MMESFNMIYQPVFERFITFIKNGHLAHAYLFAGPWLIGKSQTALSVAKFINCHNASQEGFCGQCSDCRRISSHNHPDVVVFEAITKKEADDGLLRPRITEAGEKGESRSLRIEQIRHLNAQAQLKPFEASKKVFIIKDIENLSDEAANAFLKTLEEPSPDTLIILTTSFPDKIWDTITSRCHMMHFYPLSNERLEIELTKSGAVDKKVAHFLAYFSEGCLGKAAQLENEDILKKRDEVINNLVYTRGSEAYLEGVAKDKERTKELLDILYSWYRDLLLLKQSVDSRSLIHSDRTSDLKKLEARYSFGDIEAIIDEVVSAAQLLRDNLNMKIALVLMKEKLYSY